MFCYSEQRRDTDTHSISLLSQQRVPVCEWKCSQTFTFDVDSCKSKKHCSTGLLCVWTLLPSVSWLTSRKFHILQFMSIYSQIQLSREDFRICKHCKACLYRDLLRWTTYISNKTSFQNKCHFFCCQRGFLLLSTLLLSGYCCFFVTRFFCWIVSFLLSTLPVDLLHIRS